MYREKSSLEEIKIMFRLYNVNNPAKLAALAKNCRGNVEVEFNGNSALNMKENGAEKEAAEFLKKGMRNVIVVLDNKNDLRAYTKEMLLA